MRDVVVVGGGPAGLATALAARRHGLAVLVLEAQREPIDKACGEGLMPSALASLTRLGVDLAGKGRPFTGIRYVADGVVAEADFPTADHGRGVRRTELHAELFRSAQAAGVELAFGERVLGLSAGGVCTAAGEIAARFVVGADGLHSRVRGWAHLERATSPLRQRFGVRRHLALFPQSARVEVVFGERAEAYLTPIAADEVGVALLWEGTAHGFDDLLASRMPESLRERLSGAESRSRDRGAGPFLQRTTSVAEGNVALVGDAAGYVDALTGEGLAVAFGEALALGAALAVDDLPGYRRASKRIRRRPETMTKIALYCAQRPSLRRRGVRALAAEPEFASRLLRALGGAERSPVGGGVEIVRFLFRLLATPALPGR